MEKLKQCSQCHATSYCSQECQRSDWPKHKLHCKKQEVKVDPDEIIHATQKQLTQNDFETIKKLGEGNFTEIHKVQHKKYAKGLDGTDRFYAIKVCSIQKVSSKNRQADILMEKHALNKLRDVYKDQTLPCVKLIGTFKDQVNLYFLTEILPHKNELWEHCRSFGMISPELAYFTFKQICICVDKLHKEEIVHRDLKVSTITATHFSLSSLKTCF